MIINSKEVAQLLELIEDPKLKLQLVSCLNELSKIDSSESPPPGREILRKRFAKKAVKLICHAALEVGKHVVISELLHMGR